MDSLDKQLAELQLMSELQNKANQHGSLGKKIGPAVPPKPKKMQPQVPQSYTVKQACEPSYSTRLQNTNCLPLYSNLPPSETPPLANVPAKYNAPKGYGQTPTYSNLPSGQMKNQDGLIYSNIIHAPVSSREGLYSNIPNTGNIYANGVEELPPPPPPPLEVGGGTLGPDYIQCGAGAFPPPPEDLPPPPSPVSSSYSELRRATDTVYGPGAQDYGPYTLGSQASSTYESIYEPINPRPASEMSSRSNYSLYAGYVSGAQSGVTGGGAPGGGGPRSKEEEVDALTDLLVAGMGGGGSGAVDPDDPDVYGICVKCGEKVIGESSGCTAMDHVYHITCFTCCHCQVNLQGKPFYALDGKPYCEEDYLNTLEKCCVCMKPILDRILRATGKPYHPKCFCCVICGKSLDGIPFTVDATNQIHCIEDFHKKFAPRCCVCKLPIMPEPGQDETVRVVALDRSFHINCYKCEDCGLVLSSEAEGRGCYPLDDHVLCKSCNAKRVQSLTSHMTTEL